MARLVSRADFAKLARVTKPAITKAAKKQLVGAFVEDRIDVDHAEARAYLASRGVTGAEIDRALGGGSDGAPTTKPKAGKARKADPPAPPPEKARRPPPVTKLPPGPVPRPPKIKTPERQIPLPETLEELDELGELLRPLIERFGTSRRFVDWLDALKKIEDIQKSHLQNQETEGKLISRELVETYILGAISALARTLLRDAPKTIARKAWPLAKTGRPVEEGERIVEGAIGQAFATMKEQVTKALRA
jgi:hypothetical protein